MSRGPREYSDALMEQMLRETLGGDRPRDMTARVLARAKAHDRRRRSWWISAGAAMAACIAIGITVWMLRPQEYPTPISTGFAMNADRLEPGVHMVAVSNNSAVGSTLQLGGYVQVKASPDTEFTLGGGRRFQEAVFLDRGHMDVDVSGKKGAFELVVGPATLHVTGTKFGVDVSDDIEDVDAEHSRFIKKLTVKVDEGFVVLRGLDNNGPTTISAGEPAQSFVISSDSGSESDSAPPVVTPENPPAGRGRGPNGRGIRPLIQQSEAGAAGFAQVQVISGPGPYPFDGILRRFGPYYLLQTPRGYFLLGRADEINREFSAEPMRATQVHVIFGRGKVIGIGPPRDHVN